MTDLMRAIVNLKIMAMKQILKRSATFHAIDTLTKIAGWEEASILGDDSFDLFKKVRQIYQEELDNMKGG